MRTINDSNYENETFYDRLIVIEFTGEWCTTCKAMEDTFEELEREYIDFTFYKADIEENMNLRKRYRVMGLPTVVVLENGRRVESIGGYRNIDELRSVLNKYV